MPENDGSWTRINHFVQEVISKAMVVISAIHGHIHAGRMYTARYKIIALAAGASHYLRIKVDTTTTYPIHFQHVDAETSGPDVDVNLYETPTAVVAGTPVTPRNHNRTFADAATTVIQHSAAVTTDGDLLNGVFLGGGTGVGQAVSGGVGGVDEEWILENGEHVIKVTNNGAAAVDVGVSLIWYEYLK